jgi:hypothetical protein
MGLNTRVRRSGVWVSCTSHFNALPLVPLGGVYQASIKLLRVGQLYLTGWPPLVLDAVPVDVGDWCCWRGYRF